MQTIEIDITFKRTEKDQFIWNKEIQFLKMYSFFNINYFYSTVLKKLEHFMILRHLVISL